MDIQMGLRIAIDTGGTFTDIVAIDEDTGDITATKTPSTPEDPSVGLVEGVRKVLKAAGGEPTDVHMLLHGSTVATNAVLEHKFDGLGLLVTKGFRHLIEIARQSVLSGTGKYTALLSAWNRSLAYVAILARTVSKSRVTEISRPTSARMVVS